MDVVWTDGTDVRNKEKKWEKVIALVRGTIRL